MAFFGLRDFNCVLCDRHFTMFYGDLIIQEDLICDECLVELSEMDEGELPEHVAKCLVEVDYGHDRGAGASAAREALEKRIVRKIEGLKERGASVEDMIERRKTMLGPG